MVVYIEISNTTINLGRRFKRLNEALINAFPELPDTNGIQVIRMSSAKNVNHLVDALGQNILFEQILQRMYNSVVIFHNNMENQYFSFKLINTEDFSFD